MRLLVEHGMSKMRTVNHKIGQLVIYVAHIHPSLYCTQEIADPYVKIEKLLNNFSSSPFVLFVSQIMTQSASVLFCD